VAPRRETPQASSTTHQAGKPSWLRRRLPPAGRAPAVRAALDGLATVCQEAACPNRPDCYGRGTATFLLLGPHCTRACTFCAVRHHAPRPPDPAEPRRVARAVARLGLAFCVLTMVSRDDLPDGGAEQVAATVAEIRRRCPGVGVELLISDLDGDPQALNTVLAARPEVLAHNLETVPRLYPTVRPQADYRRSLALLARAAAHPARPVVKSGLMLGLGEEQDEVLAVLDDLRAAGCTTLTLGQYLAPSPRHHPVVRYLSPEEFAELEAEARARGFRAVASAPYVRSSFRAGELYRHARGGDTGHAAHP